MKNLIINAFAFKENSRSSMQLEGKMDEKKLALYMENIFVSLKSAALKNPKDDVMLAVNAAIPSPYQELFAQENIKVKQIEFDCFLMPDSFVWSLAFYKLCALSHVVEEEKYDSFLLLDADTVTQESFEQMWEESRNGVLLYPLGHSYRHHDRERIRKDYETLYGEKISPVHYGGEYICGNRMALTVFMQECKKVYDKMQTAGFAVDSHTGDETIISIAAKETEKITDVTISPATPYIFRYWTNDFYLISTNTLYNPVCIWHLPDEKKHAMRKLFSYYKRHKVFPKREKCAAIAGIRLAKRPFNRYTLQYKIEGKLGRNEE